MTISKKDPFQDSLPEAITSSLVALLSAKAYVEMLHPISEKIKAEALVQYPTYVADEPVGHIVEKVGERIINFDDLYLASDESAKLLFDHHKADLEKLGFKAEGQKCPVLVAEGMVRDARSLLFEAMQPFTNINPNEILLTDHIKRYEKLLLDYLVPVATRLGIELNILKISHG